MVRTRMPGGVGGKAREGLPIPILLVIIQNRFWQEVCLQLFSYRHSIKNHNKNLDKNTYIKKNLFSFKKPFIQISKGIVEIPSSKTFLLG